MENFLYIFFKFSESNKWLVILFLNISNANNVHGIYVYIFKNLRFCLFLLFRNCQSFQSLHGCVFVCTAPVLYIYIYVYQMSPLFQVRTNV